MQRIQQDKEGSREDCHEWGNSHIDKKNGKSETLDELPGGKEEKKNEVKVTQRQAIYRRRK